MPSSKGVCSDVSYVMLWKIISTERTFKGVSITPQAASQRV